MINCIVCAIDGSDHSDKAAALASDLAARYQAKLRFVHVFMKGMSLAELERFADHAHLKDIVAQETDRLMQIVTAAAGPYAAAYIPPPSKEVVTRIAEVVLEDAKQVAKSKSVEDIDAGTVDGKPAEQILEFAEAVNADMIIMGNRGLGGLKGVLLGSTSQKVSHMASCTCVSVK